MQTFALTYINNKVKELFVILNNYCNFATQIIKSRMEDKTPMTMKDIAREFGISVATVSRALKDSPRISEERRRVIQ